ncbi:hypothetical protein Ahy_B05g075976 [Arachis hypogaea]|uniref:Uncharacterized protein n=1 Tax=Arachis hypogaea TaxID=3818 RepID=A0A444Z2A8_ARAHY|nr:hypothetical protein Ahy_B05g075976 [Arachis hypogaea]
MHIPAMNVPHKLLKELANSFNLDKTKLDTSHGSNFLRTFNLDKTKLDTSHGSFKIKSKIIEAALVLNASCN